MRGIKSSAWALAAAMAAFVAPALGQVSSTGNSTASGDSIPEVIVTAQRRSQDILSVPMSITATSGADLEKQGIRNFDELQFVTPGYLATDIAGSTEIYIRGVGNNVDIGADPSIALFVDDVPRIFGQMFNQFADVERIEVLKGAQGGLYGRNATGGVINVITRQPNTDKEEGTAEVSYGQKNTLTYSAFLNTPINDKIAWSVSFERDSHDPYVANVYATKNPYTAAMFPSGAYLPSAGGYVPSTPAQTANFFNSGVHPADGLDNQNLWSADTKILLKPSDIFKVTLAFDYHDKSDTDGNQLYQTQPAYTLAVIQNGFFPEVGVNANLPQSFAVSGNGKFTTTKSTDPLLDIRDYGGSATEVLSLPYVDVTSISAYRWNEEAFYNEELEDLPIPAVMLQLSYRRQFFYQELRGISNDTGPFHFMGGATWLHESQASGSLLSLLPPFVNAVPNAESTQDIKNWSVYGQVGYDFTQALNLTVSGREIHETNASAFTIPAGNGTESTERKFLPSATLSYKLPGDGTAYARFAEGFKTGGVNPLNPPSYFSSPNLGSVFGGETVYTYEVGYRAPFLDNKLQSTTAVFYNNYENLQIAAHTNAAHAGILLAIVNGGNARTYGAEQSITWRVIQPVTLGISASYLNAKYKNFEIPPNPVLVPFNLSGTTMINSPDFQLSLTANLDQPLNDKYNLIGSALFSHTSNILFQQSGLPGVLPDSTQSAYSLVNLRFGVRTADDHYEFTVEGDNVFNQAYAVNGSSSASGGNVLQWGNPRIIRGQIVAKF
jgi:iron complex outermembrane recepter protein